jgi:hypothetical protein
MADLSLEIHHLDVQGGDSTAIIVKDLEQEKDKGGKIIYSMLIDAGAERKGGVFLKAHLKENKMESFDCIVATHYHQDHILGFKQADIKFRSFLDNGAYPEKSGTTFEPRNDIGKESRTGTFDSYKDQVQDQVTNNKATRTAIPFIEKKFDLNNAKPLEIELVKNTGIKLTCYCANGILANGKNVLGDQFDKKKKPISPNDVSLALVLEWGDFRYLTAGDLSGDRDISSYYNIEQDLVDYLTDGPLKGKAITVFKASHHGSEHSNHKELLEKLQPETIIVCCNLMKQVPSPIFLNRLAEYFQSNTKARAAFTNTVKIFKNDDRYMSLKSIKKAIIKGNVEFGKDGKDDEVASNLGIKWVIIRRRVRNGNPEDYVDMNKSGTKIVKMSGYEIVFMPRDKDEAKKIENTVQFKSFDIKRSWKSEECERKTVLEAFKEQAKEMIKWINKDKKAKATVGIDYITEHYPGLLATINEFDEGAIENALITKMTIMFDNSFTLNVKTGYFEKKVDNQLTSGDKQTIYHLLIDNSFQADLNKAISPGTVTRKGLKKQPFDRSKAWDIKDYPHPTAESLQKGGQKRLLENNLENRNTK